MDDQIDNGLLVFASPIYAGHEEFDLLLCRKEGDADLLLERDSAGKYIRPKKRQDWEREHDERIVGWLEANGVLPKQVAAGIRRLLKKLDRRVWVDKQWRSDPRLALFVELWLVDHLI